MKSNLFRLYSVVSLLLCLGATTQTMGQNAGDELAVAQPGTDPHWLSYLQETPAAEPPTETFFAVVEHMKVLPGMWDEYLKVEAVWKKIHQQRKANGAIMDWFLFRSAFPGGTDASYDFIIVTYYQNAAQLNAEWNWDNLSKGLTTEEAATANGAEKTRNLIDRHLYSFFNGCGTDCKPGKYLQLFANDIKPGKDKEYQQFIEAGKPFRLEAIKSGKIQAWSIWKRLYPAYPGLDDYTAVYNYDSLEKQLANSAPFDLSAEYKKLNPTKNWDDYMKQLNELRDWMGTEMWERVDGTD